MGISLIEALATAELATEVIERKREPEACHYDPGGSGLCDTAAGF